MAITESDQDNIRQRGEGRPPGRRLLGIPATAIAWAAPFALVLAVLLARNAFLFSTPEYEDADGVHQPLHRVLRARHRPGHPEPGQRAGDQVAG